MSCGHLHEVQSEPKLGAFTERANGSAARDNKNECQGSERVLCEHSREAASELEVGNESERMSCGHLHEVQSEL